MNTDDNTFPPYPKIDSVFLRDPETKYRTFLEGEYTRPEFDYLIDTPWIGTEKVDGMNIRIGFQKIGGRTDDAQIPSQLWPKLIAVQRKLQDSGLPFTTVLYGEGYGPGIQSGGSYRNDQGFILFDVLINGNWQDDENMRSIAYDLEIDVVPIFDVVTLSQWIFALKSRVHASGSSSMVAEGRRPIEGVVLKPATELRDRIGNRIITKLKLKDFS